MIELNTETLEIRGRTVTVRELAVDELMPLSNNAASDIDRSKLLVQACATIDGAPIADAGRLPAGVFNELSRAVMRVNGLGDEGGGDDPNA